MMKVCYNNSMHKRNGFRGFTLIELSLSLAFIAVLSIIIVLIINSAISSYRRGITLNLVNSVGMDLVDDMRASVQSSSAGNVSKYCSAFSGAGFGDQEEQNCINDGGRKLISIVKTGKLQYVNGPELEEVPLFGAFCAGSYSYIWNSGYLFNDEIAGNKESMRATFTYSKNGGNNATVTLNGFKLLKVQDLSRSVCMSVLNDNAYSYDGDSGFSIGSETTLGDDNVVDLLSADTNTSLALYNLDAARPAEDSSSRDSFYSVSFILGTINGGINIKSTGDFCATPGGYSAIANFDYCAINKFNFAAQAAGGK